jgi:hypothetical protein
LSKYPPAGQRPPTALATPCPITRIHAGLMTQQRAHGVPLPYHPLGSPRQIVHQLATPILPRSGSLA